MIFKITDIAKDCPRINVVYLIRRLGPSSDIVSNATPPPLATIRMTERVTTTPCLERRVIVIGIQHRRGDSL